MLYSKLFGKTQKNVSSKFESKNHELLVKAGFIEQVGSGVFEYLPLGTRVLAKIENIVREEMNTIGAHEVLMPSLHPQNLWETTGRLQGEELFKVESKYGQKYVLAGTHEETVTPLAKKYIQSYKDLPLALYHITTKFRDEPRPKSGILRGREFRMKDLYSFHADAADLESYYKIVIEAYLEIFKRCGFNDVKVTEASGGTFTKKHSHEFNILTPAGEVDLVYCEGNGCGFAQNKEVAKVKKGDPCEKCAKFDHDEVIKEGKAIEIGNIFDLGAKFAESFDLKFKDQEGKDNYPIMGCYGIGTSRMIGALVETYNDERGIIWPESVAPYQIHLVGLDLQDESVKNQVHKVYKELQDKGVEVLFDDREGVTAGEKFADCDLIGIPHRLVVSKKTGDKVEHKRRNDKEAKLLAFKEIIELLIY